MILRSITWALVAFALGHRLSAHAVETTKLIKPTEGLTAVAMFGEKVTTITLSKPGGKPTLALKSSGGEKRERIVNDKDYKFIMDEFEKLPVIKRIPDECARARVDIFRTSAAWVHEKSSCFGMKANNSVRYVRFMNILAISI